MLKFYLVDSLNVFFVNEFDYWEKFWKKWMGLVINVFCLKVWMFIWIF